MSDLIKAIQLAQRNAGEAAVVAHLQASGLVIPGNSDAEKLGVAQSMAHRALDEASRAWYAYASLIDVGPDRVRAFEVYERVRNARRT